jgi:hypothetical protein
MQQPGKLKEKPEKFVTPRNDVGAKMPKPNPKK